MPVTKANWRGVPEAPTEKIDARASVVPVAY